MINMCPEVQLYVLVYRIYSTVIDYGIGVNRVTIYCIAYGIRYV